MKIATIGECMLEVSSDGFNAQAAQLPARLGYGGDTLNTAVYMARLGASASFVSAVGSDTASDWLLEQWRSNGVAVDGVERNKEKTLGLYLINNDDSGERYFMYWRGDSAARYFICDEDKKRSLKNYLSHYDWIYFSGITLGVLSAECRDRFFMLLADLKIAGCKVAFDGNYRPALWQNPTVARSAFDRACALSDVCLPTFDDESQLYGDADKDITADRILATGALEVVLKLGAEGCYIATNDGRNIVEGHKVKVVDTTSAGDSFNAAYLHFRSKGEAPEFSAKKGHQLASTVIQHKGAIISRDLMP